MHRSQKGIRVGVLADHGRHAFDTLLVERLVHGPLTALMLLDVIALRIPDRGFKSFDYRAVNPIPVNRRVSIHGAQENADTIRVWAEVEDPKTGHQVVGMTGRITLAAA